MAPVRSNHLVLILVVCLEVSTAADALSQGIVRNSSGEANHISDRSEIIRISEQIQFHRKGTKMSAVCRSGYEVNGCTDFPVEQLSCDCIAVDGGWMIVATATLEAVVHLWDPKILMHERQHLADLRASLFQHLQDAAIPVYPEKRVCRIKAKVMSSPSYLRDVMNKARAESNRKFRCTRGAAS